MDNYQHRLEWRLYGKCLNVVKTDLHKTQSCPRDEVTRSQDVFHRISNRRAPINSIIQNSCNIKTIEIKYKYNPMKALDTNLS